jgi:hypothetical protein
MSMVMNTKVQGKNTKNPLQQQEQQQQKSDIDNILNDLEYYMFTKETLLRLEQDIVKPKPKTEQLQEIKKKDDFFSPRQKDGLFWCFFVLAFGETEYELLNQQKINLVIEKKIKIDYVNKLREEKTIFKKQAIKFASLTHIENALVNEQTIDIKTFIALCHWSKKNVLYICKKTYFEWIPYPGEPVHIVKKIEEPSKPVRFIYEGFKQESVEKYRTSLFQVENLDKPVKAISAYKIAELMEICQKLGLETTYHDEKTAKIKNKSKQMLYEGILKGEPTVPPSPLPFQVEN